MFFLILLVLSLGLGLFWLQHKRVQIDTTQAIAIHSSPEAIWAQVQDFEGFWERSNPEAHAGTQVLSIPKQPLRNGLQFVQKERVGGITGELEAEVYDVKPNCRFRWRATATYECLGLALTLPEGGTFRIEPSTEGDHVCVSHRVYGAFPDTVWGRAIGWILVCLLDADLDAAQHTYVELAYLKEILEGQTDAVADSSDPLAYPAGGRSHSGGTP